MRNTSSKAVEVESISPTPTPTPTPTPILTEAVEMSSGLILSPRIKLLLTIYRADSNVVSPLDEWKLKRSLIDFLKSSFSIPIIVPVEDLLIRRFKHLKKRKRQDPIAHGSLFIRDLEFVVSSANKFKMMDTDNKFLEWRTLLVDKMDGMEVNLEGIKFRVTVNVPLSDDFHLMNKEWQELYAFKKHPDTIIVRGLPSRWFSEPRVSSKPSMLVTHTIFSIFGKIRNLNVAEDDDLGKDMDADDADLISGLQCKIVVQFEKYQEFYNALKALCSRSLQKEGSRMKADYEVSWDKDSFFRSARHHTQERTGQLPAVGAGQYRNEGRQSYRSRYSSDDVRSQRSKELGSI